VACQASAKTARFHSTSKTPRVRFKPRINGVVPPHQTTPGEPSAAQIINNRVLGLSDEQVLDRYHELVDKRLQDSVNVEESFELGRIEARLNAEEQTDTDRASALRRDWLRERDFVVASIERMLAQIRTMS